MPNIDADSLNNPAVNFENRSTDPAAPGSGRAKLYVKNGGVYVRLDTGDPAAVGGDIALAQGRLAVGSAGGILSALALGTEGYLVTADASGYATWAAPGEAGSGDLVKIAQTIVDGSAPAVLTFSSIPQTYRSLRLIVHGRTTLTGQSVSTAYVTLNQDTGSNYRTVFFYIGIGSGSLTRLAQDPGTYVAAIPFPATDSPAGYAAQFVMEVTGYRSPFNRTVQWQSSDWRANTATGAYYNYGFGTRLNTDALTRIDVTCQSSAAWVQGTEATLYGLN